MSDRKLGDTRTIHPEIEDMTLAEIREQILGSDMFSPVIKRVMKKFWRRCDELDAEGLDNA